MSSNGKGKKNIGKGGNPKLYVTAFYGGDVVKNSTVRLVVSEEHPQLTIAEFSKIYGSDIKANYYQTFNNINNVNESFDNGELNEKLVEGTAGQPIYKISIKDLKVHMKSACADDDDKVTQCKTINVYNKAKKGDDDAGADKKASSKKNLKKKASADSDVDSDADSDADSNEDEDEDEDAKKAAKKAAKAKETKAEKSKETKTEKAKETKTEKAKKTKTEKAKETKAEKKAAKPKEDKKAAKTKAEKAKKGSDSDSSDDDAAETKNTAKIDISDDSESESDNEEKDK